MFGATGVVFSRRCTENFGEEGVHLSGAIELADEGDRRPSVFRLV